MKAKDEPNLNSTSVKESTSENGSRTRGSHHLSLSTLKENISVPSMMSAQSSGCYSISALNAMSFVASTPAPPHNFRSCDNDVTSISAESTNCGPLGQHDEFQNSTQIESVQCQENDTSEAIKSCHRNPNEINSFNETPSRFQMPSAEKSAFIHDASNIIHSKQVNSIKVQYPL